MCKLEQMLQNAGTVAIAGHVNPDGDSIGSCMALYLYLRDNFPGIQADVYLETWKEEFSYLEDIGKVKAVCEEQKIYDVFFAMDVSRDRIGVADACFETARHTVCIDHHVTNRGYADENYVDPSASATCEVLFELIDEKKISKACAEALYTGIIHDCGVFQYSNTSPKTLRIAAVLLEKGVPASEIIDGSFNMKTYVQNQILGRTLLESILLLDKKCIVGIVRQREMKFYGLTPKDLDGIVSHLRATRGVEAALFLYETAAQQFKVSMRSNGRVDVSAIAAKFGGGGHIKAAGCTMQGSVYDVINNITYYIEQQLKAGEQ